MEAGEGDEIGVGILIDNSFNSAGSCPAWHCQMEGEVNSLWISRKKEKESLLKLGIIYFVCLSGQDIPPMC